MTTKCLDLKPERHLLENNFGGYKLSLKSLDSTKCDLESSVERLLINHHQCSLLHAKIYGLHNFLTGETTDTYENVYFINQNKNVQKGNFNSVANEIDVSTVWSIPVDGLNSAASKTEKYNISLKLISENFAVLSDGYSSIFILNTGERDKNCLWQLIHKEELSQLSSFYIQDAVLKDSELHIILCNLKACEKKTQLIVNWVTFLNEDNSWKQVSVKQLFIKGDVSYLYLEKTCEAIYVASSGGCRFTSESAENEIIELVTEEKSYKWSQDSEFVVIHFIMPEDIQREDVQVFCGSSNIKVDYQNKCLLSGVLFSNVDNTLITVTQSKNLLEINLVKQDKHLTWLSLLKENDITLWPDEFYFERDVSGTLDHLTSDKQEDPPQGITFNTEEVEECDFSNDDYTIFERLCGKTLKVTHKYNLGSNQILLTVKTQKNGPPSLGIRQDVDVCIWDPRLQEGDFKLQHIATLLAFGYIQASKQQKKFLTCPPDYSYSLICDTTRHMFLYRQKSSVKSGELRNRKLGTRVDSIAEQQIICIPNEEILGLYASPTAIYALGETFLIHIKIQ